MLAGKGSEDLAPPALAQLFPNILDELALLRVQLFFRKVRCGGNQERHQMFCLSIEPLAPDLSDTEGMIRIQHEAMQHQAHEAAVATVRFECPLNVLLNSHIGFAESRIECNLADDLFIGRKIVGNVFERDEDGRAHQELAKEER